MKPYLPRLGSRPLTRAAAVPVLALLLSWGGLASAQQVGLPFTVTFSGNLDQPHVVVQNLSEERINTFILYCWRDWGWGYGEYGPAIDYVTNLTADGSTIPTLVAPTPAANLNDEGLWSDTIQIAATGWDPGRKVEFDVEMDSSYTYLFGSTEIYTNTITDYRLLFKSPYYTYAVVGSSNRSEWVVCRSNNISGSVFTFGRPRELKTLTAASMIEDGSAGVSGMVVRVRNKWTGDVVAEYLVGEEQQIQVAYGDVVEISSPSEIYRDIYGTDISTGGDNDSELIQDEAAERLSVVNITVDETTYQGVPPVRFRMEEDRNVLFIWRQEFALIVEQDFANTISPDVDEGGNPWVGPVESLASGNPDPTVKKHWIKKGTTLIAQIDGQVLDYTRPGLDVRYVPVGFTAYGPPNRDTDLLDDSIRFTGVDISTNPANVRYFSFTVDQQPPGRQQISQFTMYGPGFIKYKWQLQLGVKVSMDDVALSALPRVYRMTAGGLEVVGVGEGTFWFNPGAAVKVACAANVSGPLSDSLKGWINGDGYYFTSQGNLDDTQDGILLEGGPGVDQSTWDGEFFDPNSGMKCRGMEIPNLQRAVRVMWRFGAPAIGTEVLIGQYVFEGDTENENRFTTPPDGYELVRVTGANKNVDGQGMAVWDPVALRLYPVVPGMFRVTWRPDPASSNVVEVLVNASYPQPAHYPHIANAPLVALDPDPTDNLSFQEVKYTENMATVDAQKRFAASTPGRSVLLFKEIQAGGRGAPREFLRVRVVETKNWNTALPASMEVIVGKKITDPALDLAGLGCGYLLFDQSRYNPYVYDVDKLTGIAAKNIYDMTKLKSTSAQKVIVHPEALPGPVIPVNLHPGATVTQRLVVVWYDDPAQNDMLLWPHAARVYMPRWPRNEAEGLGSIVIASQYGSESIKPDGSDQVVVGAVTTRVTDSQGHILTNVAPAETTYNPSRLQAVQIYSQPDPTLPGYNPNEEHALMAPSLRYAAVSPRPPAAYALRVGDLNRVNLVSQTEAGQSTRDYTSHPFVLVQFFDTALGEYGMRVYSVVKENPAIPGYRFAATNLLVASTPSRVLQQEPMVEMEAGEPVIPFYPLGVAIGASPCPESFGNNIKNQKTYWEDHKGSAWAVSGGENAWFTFSTYYPLAPDFWWPDDVLTPPIQAVDQPNGTTLIVYDDAGTSSVPRVGDSVAFLPSNVKASPTSSGLSRHVPTLVLYHSRWPDVVPVLKAGETLTFSGGEYRADHSTMVVPDGDGVKTVETPGLPGVLAFACAEVVFDMLNPTADSATWRNSWSARVGQVLDFRKTDLEFDDFPEELAPATGRSRVSSGLYVFNELSASLQKRFRFDPLNGKLVFFGLVNDKDIADRTLTASPPAVYVLEPNIMTEEERDEIQALDDDSGSTWDDAVESLYQLTRNPNELKDASGNVVEDQYLVGLDRDSVTTTKQFRAFGPGLAVLPNAGFLDPDGMIPDPADPTAPGTPFPEISYVTVVENNDPSLGGSPITPYVIKIDRRERYRGAIKTVLSDNVFDENMVLRHTGDFGANADELVFEWWYRPDDGSVDVPPPNLIPAGQPNPWMLYPDPSGQGGVGRTTVMLKGNPNAPEALLADTWWFARYRHVNDVASGTDWDVEQPDGSDAVNYDWAGAGNSDPFNDYDNNGLPDYRAQLAMGWIKRVLDAVNPYEARIRDFEGENPATYSSLISELGARYEGPVALNPSKNVIENVGLIELYQTILKRGMSLSIDLSRPVATPAIFNALELVSTRLADFYTLLGNEAYVDAQDPTIGFGSDSVEYGSLAPAVFSFQNQQASLMDEELALLRGVDDYFARPVYNRLFWNFMKGEGEAAYAMNYDITDVNLDGFIDEDDAMLLYPQGHGDAWGHYLSAMKYEYDLLNHSYFNWVSRSEYYNLMDIVIGVDFLDERKFAQMAAAKAKAGAEIVNLTYRDKYVEDPTAQWQGYTDSLKDRSWGVQDWARRAGQGALFDWVTANALLPSVHPNSNLTGIAKVDREENGDIPVVSANFNAIQRTIDSANNGYCPLGLSGDIVPFDIDIEFLEIGSGTQTKYHFRQIYERAVAALENAVAVWDNANEARNMLRQVANSESEYRNEVFQQDLSYRNQLIAIFGKPYEGTVGPGKLYPAGYDGPDLSLYMYVETREITKDTVPGPAASFATFNASGGLSGGALYDAFNSALSSGYRLTSLDNSWRLKLASTFAQDANGNIPAKSEDGLFAVNYTDLQAPKVPLANLTELMPVTAAGYTFQAPEDWGARPAYGELQSIISQMVQQEAEIAKSIAEYDAFFGEIIRKLNLIDAKIEVGDAKLLKNEIFSRLKAGIEGLIKALEALTAYTDAVKEAADTGTDAASEMVPKNLPTGGLAVSPGDAAAPARGGIQLVKVVTDTAAEVTKAIKEGLKAAAEIALSAAENELTLWEGREDDKLAKKEFLKDLEDAIGDEASKRIAIFKEIETLAEQSDSYRSKLDEGIRLIDERAAFNKRVAAKTQTGRYQDMTFRVSRNHALQNYRASFDLAARYAYMAAKAYDYETNLDPSDPGSAQDALLEIVKARTVGQFDGDPRLGKGGLSEALAKLNANYTVLESQLGINNPELETGKMSLRTELFRILPKGASQPSSGFPNPGEDSDLLWRAKLQQARVADLWELPEFRYSCTPLAGIDAGPQPALVFRFGTEVYAGKNTFGRALAGGDHTFDPSRYATKIQATGIWFSDYLSGDVVNDLPSTPRVYFFPAGSDIMRVPNTGDPDAIRIWDVVDQRIPVPFPSVSSALDTCNWIPLLDSLNGRMGDPRKFSMMRAYHDGSSEVNMDELSFASRLIGRSVWNTEWLLIIPGSMLNADPDEGLDRFISQVSDIKLVFKTYGYPGN